MSDVEKESLQREERSLSQFGASERFVDGNQLVCPVCKKTQFWKRKTLMNTPALTFLGFDWANRQAENYICVSCGYLMWFLREE